MASLFSSTETVGQRAALVDPDGRIPVERSPLVLARRWSRSTPGWLRILSGAVIVAIALSVVVAVVAASVRRSSSAQVQTTTAGALIDAQSLSVSLSDATTSAAGSFLVAGSGSRSDELDERYQNDLAEASASLARLAGQVNTTSDRQQIQKLTTDLPTFSGIVETARVNVAQQKAVGAAYLGEANSLMRREMLPAADQIYRDTRARVDADEATATGNAGLIVTAVVFTLAVGGLVLLQLRLSRRFHRTVNPPMALATVLVLVAFGWTMAAFVLQGRALDQARHDGSDPIAQLTEARIDAHQLRADDELTILTHDTNSAYQGDYTKVAADLEAMLAARPGNDVISRIRRDASAVYANFADVHQQLRDDTAAGRPNDALKLATDTTATDQPAVSDHLDQVLASGVEDRSRRFYATAPAATDDLWGLPVGLTVLGAGAIALVIVGTRRRLAEYR